MSNKKKSNMKTIIIDGQEYTLVPKEQVNVVSELKWQEGNLQVLNFRNGDPITFCPTDEDWQNASENQQPAFCFYENDITKGVLYNWYAVNDSRGLAPDGMRIPTIEELMDASFVNDFPGGFRGTNGTYTTIGNHGYWWSSTKYDSSYAWNRNLNNDYSIVNRYYNNKQYGFSVRCLTNI